MTHRIGIDLGGTKIEAIVMNEHGDIVHANRVATPSDYFQTLTVINQLVKSLESEVGEICPVGIGTPGAWIPSKRSMKNCNSTCLNGRPLLEDLRKLLARPIRIANDADCFTLSEALDGAGVKANCVFGVILGTGVGGGWVVNGQLLRGPNALSGEWGHNLMPALRQDKWTEELENRLADRECYCGRINCVETYLSGPGLQKTHHELSGEHIDSREIVESLTGKRTMELYMSMLARALAQVVNVVDPDVIVLGGGVSNATQLYDVVPDLLVRYAFSSENATRIERAKYGDSSGKRGAAWLF